MRSQPNCFEVEVVVVVVVDDVVVIVFVIVVLNVDVVASDKDRSAAQIGHQSELHFPGDDFHLSF